MGIWLGFYFGIVLGLCWVTLGCEVFILELNDVFLLDIFCGFVLNHVEVMLDRDRARAGGWYGHIWEPNIFLATQIKSPFIDNTTTTTTTTTTATTTTTVR